MNEPAENRVGSARLAEVSEADAADQAAPVADDDADLELDAIERAASRSMARDAEADPADVWEQSVPVGDDDEGYGHD